MTTFSLRKWQTQAFKIWEENDHRGIVSVVTGGGKTVFALHCIREAKRETAIVVVPTLALLDQWWDETAAFFSIRLDDVNIVTGRQHPKAGTVNLVVLNTAASVPLARIPRDTILVVDECHKAAAPEARKILGWKTSASLGLSATPERPYDSGLSDLLVPSLGPVVFTYTYREALRDEVIVPFSVRNIVFELEEDRQKDFDKLTRAVARSIDRVGFESPETLSLLLRRARVLNLSFERIRIAVKLVAANRGKKVLVFHENIEACDAIHEVLVANSIAAAVYHSKLALRKRAEILAAYRRGSFDVLVTCRALDEGFNVPETEIGIIAASTATRRQRIQRLGRILRPSVGKEGAAVYTLAASVAEIERLREEERDLEGVADVSWSRA